MAQAIARARRRRTQFALLLPELDIFARINGRLGHAHGDAVLWRLPRDVSSARFAPRHRATHHGIDEVAGLPVALCKRSKRTGQRDCPHS
ncbi:MAG: diguanylate cyclase [Burkholderiaceae bacterium]